MIQMHFNVQICSGSVAQVGCDDRSMYTLLDVDGYVVHIQLAQKYTDRKCIEGFEILADSGCKHEYCSPL
jgi:hypothetical protein